MCTPTGLLVGGLALSGTQAYMGYQQGQAQAANASAAAATGYAGAMEEYNAQVDYINRQEEWKWTDYQRNVAHRQELMEFQIGRYGEVIDAVSTDLKGKYDTLQSGLLQLRESTMNSLQDLWVTYSRGAATRRVNAAHRGVEGPSIDAVAGDALRAMYMQEETALTQLEWSVGQGQREAEGYYAQGLSAINAARPQPLQQVALPTPMAMLNAPTWAPYAIQSQAGQQAGYNTSANALIGGASGALGSYGTYYGQMNPPAPPTVYNTITT